MTFRRATKDDLPALLELQEEGAIAGLGHIFPQEQYPFPREAVLARWTEELTDSAIQAFVSTDGNGGLTGFAAIRGNELLHFGTAKSTWGSGTARQLHDALLREMAKSRDPEQPAHLWVFEDNKRARRFYEKHGWTQTEERKPTVFPPHPTLVQYVHSLERTMGL